MIVKRFSARVHGKEVGVIAPTSQDAAALIEKYELAAPESLTEVSASVEQPNPRGVQRSILQAYESLNAGSKVEE